MVVHLENEFVERADKLPKDVTEAYSFLENWKKSVINIDIPHNDGVSFAQFGYMAAHGEESAHAQGSGRAPRDPS